MEIETYASKDNCFVKCGINIRVTNRNNLEVQIYKNYLNMPKMLMYDFIKARAVHKKR
ncbi:MAG: hypothetical protein K5912_04415 [Alphaproteobacteria bacterium]|nr:hypothetical protein [Alphaproteobacteria bacterium]